MAIGSVGTSAVPIFDTTCRTSGNSERKMFSALVVERILSFNELPGGMVICMARSPSSRVGINSEPILENKTPAPIINPAAVASTA